MGRIGFRGETSSKLYQLKETVSTEVSLVNETDGVTLLRASPTSVIDAAGVTLSSHASRHSYGGADAIPVNGLRYIQIRGTIATGSSVSVAAGGTYTVPEGVWYVFLGPNTRCEAYDDVASSWKTVISAGGSGLVISDGANVRLNNSGGSNEASNMREVQ